MRIPDNPSRLFFCIIFRVIDSVVLSCHLLHKRATTAIDAWWKYMSLHGQQQGVKSAESDPGDIQSPVEGQRLRSVQVAAAGATELHQCTYTKAAHQYDHSAEKSSRTITNGGGGTSRTPLGGWCGARPRPSRSVHAPLPSNLAIRLLQPE